MLLPPRRLSRWREGVAVPEVETSIVCSGITKYHQSFSFLFSVGHLTNNINMARKWQTGFLQFPSRYVSVQNSLLFEAFDKSLHTESAKTLLKNCCLKKSKCCLCETASVGRGTWQIRYYFRLECYLSSLILSTCCLVMGYNTGLDWLHEITWKKWFVSPYL